MASLYFTGSEKEMIDNHVVHRYIRSRRTLITMAWAWEWKYILHKI